MLQNKVGGGKPKMRFYFGEILHCELLKAQLACRGQGHRQRQPVCLALDLKQLNEWPQSVLDVNSAMALPARSRSAET